MSRGRLALPLILAGLSGFFGLFLVYPLIRILGGSFIIMDGFGRSHFSFYFYSLLWQNQLDRLALSNSLELAIVATLGSGLIALPLSFLLTRYRFAGRDLLRGTLLLPIMLPPFVGAIGLKHLFARYGAFNLSLSKLGLVSLANPPDWFGGSGFTGVAILEILHLFPIFYFSLAAALAGIDAPYLEAAAGFGARGWRRFWTITLPLARPGLFAGASIVFISAFTDLGTPLIFNFTATVPTQIFNATADVNNEPIGYALVVVTLVLVLAIYLLVRRFGEAAMLTVLSGARRLDEIELKPVPGALAAMGVGLLISCALLPHLGVLLTSVAERWFFTIFPSDWSVHFYQEIATDRFTGTIIANSLFYSGLSALLDLALGVVIAQLLARESFLGKSLLDGLAMLPLALPGLVLAFGLLMSFDTGGFWRQINPRENPTFLLVISYSLRRLPYIVRAAYAGFQQISVTLEEASANLGAGWAETLRRVTLPLLAPSLVAGTILTFCFAMLEVSDSLILAMESRFAPITRGIYEIMGRPIPDAASLACALGVVAMLLLGGGLFLGARLLGRDLGALFRL